MSQLTILACQIEVPPMVSTAQRDAHVAQLVASITQQCQQHEVDLVVLPELATVDYSRTSFDKLTELAESIDGPSFQAFSALAKSLRVAVVFGMPRCENGRYYISQVVINAEGHYQSHYDKIHIAQFGDSMEKEYFQRGQHLCVFEVKGVRLAPIICYDIRIPELTRTLVVDHQVDCILHCGAYARDESFYSWHDFAVTRAIENQVYFLSLNRAGQHYGHSVFCAPWIDENQPAFTFPQHSAFFAQFEIDTQNIQRVRQEYTFLADRLPDYRKLAVR